MKVYRWAGVTILVALGGAHALAAAQDGINKPQLTTQQKATLKKVDGMTQTPAPPGFRPPMAEVKPVALEANSVYDFLVYAATATRSQKEEIRAMIARKQGDEAISKEVQALYPKILADDFDFALVTLSILGELRAKNAIGFFVGVLNQPYPEERMIADPGLTKRESIELLQSKAVQGLAYLKDPTVDAIVMKAAREHPSKAVRNAAVEALLYNASDRAGVRKSLGESLRKEDLIFLDQVSRGATQSPDDFNRQLAAFAERHPEARYEAPGEPTVKPKPVRPQKPRKDEGVAPKSGNTEPR